MPLLVEGDLLRGHDRQSLSFIDGLSNYPKVREGQGQNKKRCQKVGIHEISQELQRFEVGCPIEKTPIPLLLVRRNQSLCCPFSFKPLQFLGESCAEFEGNPRPA